jgi:hypothetical protein
LSTTFLKPFWHWTLAVFFAFAFTKPGAADVRVEENAQSVTIHIYGRFRAQDFNRLDAMLEQMEKRRALTDATVTLDSPGGSHFEALRLGLLLHRKGIGTQILPGATCFSACASVFFGGFDRKTGRPNRVAHEGSRLGVHRFKHIPDGRSRSPTASDDARVLLAARSYFADMRISGKLLRMFEETPFDQIYIVTPSDMAESDITFVPAASPMAKPVVTLPTSPTGTATHEFLRQEGFGLKP